MHILFQNTSWRQFKTTSGDIGYVIAKIYTSLLNESSTKVEIDLQ